MKRIVQRIVVAVCLVIGVALVLHPEHVAAAAGRVKIFNSQPQQVQSVIAATRTGNVVAQSSVRIRSQDDMRRLSEVCGPLYHMDLVCGGHVDVKAPPNSVACGTEQVGCKSIMYFSDGSKVTATKKVHSDGSASVRLDHDKK